MSDKLKECPLCGGDKVFGDWNFKDKVSRLYGRYEILCNTCGAGVSREKRPEAILVWSMRSEQDKINHLLHIIYETQKVLIESGHEVGHLNKILDDYGWKR